jgi:hypothetical protein
VLTGLHQIDSGDNPEAFEHWFIDGLKVICIAGPSRGRRPTELPAYLIRSRPISRGMPRGLGPLQASVHRRPSITGRLLGGASSTLEFLEPLHGRIERRFRRRDFNALGRWQNGTR